MKAIIAITLLCSGLIPHAIAAGPAPGNWPQFRGPNSQGVADTQKPPVAFGPDKALLWKTPLPSGVSSPCIWGNRIFVTAFDPERKQLETICLDRKTGKVLWRKDSPVHETERVHEISSPANMSPATDGLRVFVQFATYGVVAYDFHGTVAWTKPLPRLRSSYGPGASPVVSGDTLLLKIPNAKSSQLLAIRCRDGTDIWKASDPSYGGGWASPVVWRESGSPVVGVYNMGELRVLDLQTGADRWKFSGTPPQICATPAIGDGVIYLTGTGMFGNRENVVAPPPFERLLARHDTNKDGRLGTDELPDDLLFVNRGTSGGAGSHHLSEMLREGPEQKHRSFDKAEWEKAIGELLNEFQTLDFMKTAAFAVRTGGQGDATNNLVWSEPKGVPEVPSPLLYRGRLYYIKNGGLFTCRDPKTGKSLYDERVGAEGGYYASPVAADGRIYIASDRGAVTVLKAGDAFTVLSRAELKETIMATPALVENKLYVRSAGHLWAFGESRGQQH